MRPQLPGESDGDHFGRCLDHLFAELQAQTEPTVPQQQWQEQ